MRRSVPLQTELENRELRLDYSRPERISLDEDINRRFFSPEQKVAILREHLVEGRAVSDLCEKHRIHPTVFYQWQRQFFENGTAAFESKQSRSRVSDGYQKKLEALEQKLQRKNQVLSELLEEHTRLKKELWES